MHTSWLKLKKYPTTCIWEGCGRHLSKAFRRDNGFFTKAKPFTVDGIILVVQQLLQLINGDIKSLPCSKSMAFFHEMNSHEINWLISGDIKSLPCSRVPIATRPTLMRSTCHKINSIFLLLMKKGLNT